MIVFPSDYVRSSSSRNYAITINAMKVYIKRNNLHLDLIRRCNIFLTLFTFTFCEATGSMQYRPTDCHFWTVTILVAASLGTTSNTTKRNYEAIVLVCNANVHGSMAYLACRPSVRPSTPAWCAGRRSDCSSVSASRSCSQRTLQRCGLSSPSRGSCQRPPPSGSSAEDTRWWFVNGFHALTCAGSQA